MDIKLDIYNDECLQLAKSMYLKFDLHALSVERWYTKSKSVDPDKRKWLQYMNLAGEYHAANSKMTIKSLDTFKDISFDKETLKDHPTTLSIYREFGKQFSALVKRYPDNEVLIKGILYDRDIDDIIAMEDFHIVGYNKSLIDIQEYDLISTLNRYLTVKGTSAGCPDYIESEELYPSAVLAFVTGQLPVLIKRVRLDNSKTYQANTFYIWSHINSVINLEEYKGVLTYDDVMYLFKNIIRLKNGLCTKDVFLEVLTTIVTPKMIDAYYLESNVQVSTLSMEDHSAEAIWQNRNVVSDEVRAHNVGTVITDHRARSKYRLADDAKDLSGKLYREYNTQKYPELTLYDNREHEGNVRELLTNVDYAYLIGGLGMVTRFYEITLPHNGQTVTLQHNDWLTIYTRIQQIKFGHKTETIPPHETTQLYRYTPISQSKLIDGGLDVETAGKILDIIGTFPTIRNDLAGIANYVNNFVNTKSTVVSLLSRSYNKRNNVYIGELNSLIFGSYLVSFHDKEINFDEWLNDINVDLDEMSLDTLYQLEYLILTKVIGISGDSADSLVNLIGGMLHKFTSYKTNISRKMSDTITLSLSGRPSWNAQPTDLAGLGDIIDISMDVIAEQVGGDDEAIDITPMSIQTRMSKEGGTAFAEITRQAIRGDVITNTFRLNTRPLSVYAEILEPENVSN